MFEFVTGKRGSLPLAAFQAGVGVRHVTAHGEEDRHRMLGRRVGVAEGSVDDNDAAFTGSHYIDIVDTDPCTGNHFQIRSVAQKFGVHLGS